jgi:arginase
VETIAVPVSSNDVRPVDGSIVSREALLKQLTAARSAIARHQPEAIATLGGDCLVDLAPIAYLSECYGDDLAVLWVDAHPDVMGPAQFHNAHAHVLAMLMGEGDSDFVSAVRRPLNPCRILYVGLTETTPFETGFIDKHGLAHLSPDELAASAEPVLAWLRATGAKRVAVHFDVDLWIPPITTFCCSATRPPRRMRSKAWPEDVCACQVSGILNAVAAEADIVGLAIAE